jgi:hypothetical protein
MKRTITTLATVACLASGAVAASTAPSSALAATPTCTKLSTPVQVYGTWYKCTDSTNNTTRYTGTLSATNGAAVMSFPGWNLRYNICLDTEIETGYRPGSSVVSFSVAPASLCR